MSLEPTLDIPLATPAPPPLGPGLTELESLGERIAELAAQISAATWELLALIRDFDSRSGWNSGFRSCAHWLNWRTGIDLGAAREKVRVARALDTLPTLSGAMCRGELSYSKVRALTRIATPANEAELLVFAMAGTASHVEKLVRASRRVDRLAEDDGERRHAGRYLRAYPDEDGMVTVAARLSPEAGAALLRALDAAEEKLFGAQRRPSDGTEETTAEQRRADALGLIAEAALTASLDPGTRGDRYQIVVHVDAEALGSAPRRGVRSAPDVSAETCSCDNPMPRDLDGDVSAETRQRRTRTRYAGNLDEGVAENPHGRLSAAGLNGTATLDGAYVSAETSRRLGCDGAVVTMRHAADGSVLDVGRRTRAISPALRRALDNRDGGCRFPGCGLRLCDAHHVEHWADGGKTSLGNTVLLCRRHHGLVHEGGWRVENTATGGLTFYRPDGRVLLDSPRLPPVSENPVEALVSRLATRNVAVDRRASMPQWDGRPIDLSWSIDCLRALDKRTTDPIADNQQPS
jgi:hypothetical protein